MNKSYSQLRNIAWNALKGHWAEAVMAFVLYVVLATLAASTVLGAVFVVLPLAFGFAIAMLKFLRGDFRAVDNLFAGFKSYGRSLGAVFMVKLYTFLWSLLFIIPGLIKDYAYSMTYFILEDDPQLSIDDAIEKSKVMMDGHKWELFVLDLSFIGWYCLVLVTVGIAALWVTPYILAAHAAFYEEIKDTVVEVGHEDSTAL